MPDDFVIDIKQIGNYPFVGRSVPSDYVVLQRLGLGGPYLATNAYGLLQGAMGDPDSSFGVGMSPPWDAVGGQMFVNVGNVMPPNGMVAWNAFLAQSGLNYLTNGAAGIISMDPALGFTWAYATPGGADQPLQNLTDILRLSPLGSLSLGGAVAPTDEGGSQVFADTVNVPTDGFVGFNAYWNGNAIASWDGGVAAIMGIDPALGWVLEFSGGGTLWQQYLRVDPSGNLIPIGQVRAPSIMVPRTTGSIGFNVYNGTGYTYAQQGSAGFFTFDHGQLTWNNAPPGVAGSGIGVYTPTMTLDHVGNFNVTGIATAGADPQNSLDLVTLQYLIQYVADHMVTSFNGRTGDVTLTLADVTGAGGAPLHSPHFTGIPRISDTPQLHDLMAIANVQFVENRIAWSRQQSVLSWNGRMGNVVLTLSDITTAGGASIHNPFFTGSAVFQGTISVGGLASLFGGMQVVGNSILQGGLSISGVTNANAIHTISPNNNDNSNRVPTTAWTRHFVAEWVPEYLEDVYVPKVPTHKPEHPRMGEMWWDMRDAQLYVFDTQHGQWIVAVNQPLIGGGGEDGDAGVHWGAFPPMGPHFLGRLWFDTGGFYRILKIWDGANWENVAAKGWIDAWWPPEPGARPGDAWWCGGWWTGLHFIRDWSNDRDEAWRRQPTIWINGPDTGMYKRVMGDLQLNGEGLLRGWKNAGFGGPAPGELHNWLITTTYYGTASPGDHVAKGATWFNPDTNFLELFTGENWQGRGGWVPAFQRLPHGPRWDNHTYRSGDIWYGGYEEGADGRVRVRGSNYFFQMPAMWTTNTVPHKFWGDLWFDNEGMLRICDGWEWIYPGVAHIGNDAPEPYAPFGSFWLDTSRPETYALSVREGSGWWRTAKHFKQSAWLSSGNGQSGDTWDNLYGARYIHIGGSWQALGNAVMDWQDQPNHQFGRCQTLDQSEGQWYGWWYFGAPLGAKPQNARLGTLWYDNGNLMIKAVSPDEWWGAAQAPTRIGFVAPDNPMTGALWFNQNNGDFKTYHPGLGGWVDIYTRGMPGGGFEWVNNDIALKYSKLQIFAGQWIEFGGDGNQYIWVNSAGNMEINNRADRDTLINGVVQIRGAPGGNALAGRVGEVQEFTGSGQIPAGQNYHDFQWSLNSGDWDTWGIVSVQDGFHLVTDFRVNDIADSGAWMLSISPNVGGSTVILPLPVKRKSWGSTISLHYRVTAYHAGPNPVNVSLTVTCRRAR